jgi:cysteine synthase B
MHHTDIIDSIGDTPLVELKHCSPKPGVRLFAKLEGTNPTGSVKDRIVKEMVLDAESAVTPGDTIVEASTGFLAALAMVGVPGAM